MTNKIYLGYHKKYGSTYLYKHSWDCGWYWGFGYVGNNNCHWHIDAMIKHPYKYDNRWTDIDTHFIKTWITQNQWWILRDLFISAYALKEAAGCYRTGGHQTEQARPYSVINADMEKQLNADLGKILDNIWMLLEGWKNNVSTDGITT